MDHMRSHFLAIILTLLVFASPDLALGDPADAYEAMTSGSVRCDFPVVDVPFNTRGHAFPSMQQSLGLTACTYEVAHRSILRLFSPPKTWWSQFWRKMAVAGFDLFMMPMPLGEAWLHEEWHRAVMSARDINSYNEVYKLDLTASVIQVSHVSDAELTRLKRDHNPDLVRLAAAGVEGSLEFVHRLERHAFFDGVNVFNAPLYFMSYAGVIGYIDSGDTETPDTVKDERTEQKTEKERDFVGHDFTSWVYDLFRPDEPYDARGPHPTGNGVDRYRGKDDLTSEEVNFLRLQGTLSYLNLIDPFLIGGVFQSETDPDKRWNAKLRHFLTSSGYAIDGNFFLRTPHSKQLFTLHGYRNAYRWFPGFEWELIDAQCASGFTGSLRIMAWQQPKEQIFHTRDADLGGLLGLRVGQKLSETIDVFYEASGKSEGWVAGTPYLDRVLELRVGTTARL